MKKSITYGIYFLALVFACFAFTTCLNPFLQRPVLTYTVTFDSMGGEEVPSQKVVSGKKAVRPDDPDKKSSDFLGWFSDEYLTDEYDFDTPVSEDITLYADWKLIRFTVSFEPNGGTPPPPLQTVNRSDRATVPPIMTNVNGEIFGGWYSDSDCTAEYIFSRPVTGDLILYAKWTTITYTVSFNANGGSAVPPQTLDPNQTAAEPAKPDKYYYDFIDWYRDPNFSGSPYDFTAPVTESFTLHAKWTPQKYTVTYDSKGGSPVASQTVDYPGPFTRPSPDPINGDLIFVNWYTDESLSAVYDFNRQATTNMTLYAKWDTVPPVTVTFYSPAFGTVYNTETVASGDPVAPPDPAPTREGYDFDGWCVGITNNEYSFSLPVTSDLFLTARWTPATWTITYRDLGDDPFSGTHGVGYPTTHTYNTVTNLVEPTKDNYVFGGWFIDRNGAGTALTVLSATGYTENITLYAKWTSLYAVAFDTDGGIPEPVPNPQMVNPNGMAVRPATDPEKSGFVFGGWYSDAGTNTVYIFSTPVTENITLYAKWNPYTIHTVSFKKTDDPLPSDQRVNTGDPVTQPPTPTRKGYIFDNYWYRLDYELDNEGKPIPDDAGKPIKWNFAADRVTDDLTLYAGWKIDMIDLSSQGDSFLMGTASSPTTDAREVYQHEVKFTYDFSIGKYEVTQEQYSEVMGRYYFNHLDHNPSNHTANPPAGERQIKRPVENITWYDAALFCNVLSEWEFGDDTHNVYTIVKLDPGETHPQNSGTWRISNGRVTADFSKDGYRLPTEAEWEYACRAGTTTSWYTGDTEAGLGNAAWYNTNSGNTTHEVGKKDPNAFGLYDMHGNVQEFVWDYYVSSYPNLTVTNPTGPNTGSTGEMHIMRGGSATTGGGAGVARSAHRETMGNTFPDAGFRVVRGAITP